MNDELLLDAIVTVGEGILVCGGEIFRVEDSIERMLSSYDIKKSDVFTITSTITVTIHTNCGKIHTNTRRITKTELNLKRLDMLNSLSRYICLNRPDPVYILREYNRIMNTQGYPVIIKNISYAVVAFSFCKLNNGKIYECFVSAILGIILINLFDNLKKYGINKFIALMASSFICGISGRFLAFLLTLDHTKIAIGNIMLLLPGLTVTNALRDLITGDLMAGILHLCDGILIATGLALGFAIAQI